MILATHGIIGAGLASFFPNNFGLAFAVSFASHFALDIIPHWDYELLSQTKNKENRLEEDIKIGKNFFLIWLKIILDVAIGSVFGRFVFSLLAWRKLAVGFDWSSWRSIAGRSAVCLF